MNMLFQKLFSSIYFANQCEFRSKFVRFNRIERSKLNLALSISDYHTMIPLWCIACLHYPAIYFNFELRA